MSKDIIRTEDLSKEFYSASSTMGGRGRRVLAVDKVNLSIKKEEIFGLVGESGCGKTTLGRLISALENPTGGRVLFNGEDPAGLRGRELRTYRRRMGFVFQDPSSSLNPRMTAGTMIGEPLVVHGLARGKELERRVAGLMADVGLSPTDAARYPHEFSGGQRQRIGLARAIAAGPEFVVCDEPTSNLDLSVAAGILNLFMAMQKGRQLSYLFISHDLRAVAFLSDRIAVMYLGNIVELGDRKKVYNRPHHPYTIRLLAALPRLEAKKIKSGTGRVGSESWRVSIAGCRYLPRCERAKRECGDEMPGLRKIDGGHFSACFFD